MQKLANKNIDYALPVYFHSLRVSEKAKLDQIQYTAGKIYGRNMFRRPARGAILFQVNIFTYFNGH